MGNKYICCFVGWPKLCLWLVALADFLGLPPHPLPRPYPMDRNFHAKFNVGAPPPRVGPPSYGESLSCPCSWLPCHLLNYVFSPSETPLPPPPLQADTPPSSGRHPGQTATAAGGTHPTGIHCSLFIFQKMEQKCRLNLLRLLLFLTLACLTFFIVVCVVDLNPYLESTNYVNTSCIMVRNGQ